ncbi:ArnT family glycosyltransferase [Stagnihabitans tardus]|uniref:Phospholipid carrier-dependent glycosyltransferase n=1 Tax=Stagnihabitans tardus TaxID=2699202 RepID=A0AAE4Y9A1_9RHOB|nr:glycosyltransferase family 39 protein [Stagnihabitans tardus]NBZ88422.1 phospholipid carrier-dependent glycosyltransferase [Stagnihabitans tardus]
MGWLTRQVQAGRGVFLALAVMLACGLPGLFSLPPLDRDEVLFSQASRQMAASGDMIDIRFAEMPRYKKPVGIYWLQVAAAKVTGQPDAIWSYRLVSLLAAMVAVAATHAIGRRLLTAEGALLASVALAASVMLGIEAHLAKTDATLLATVAVSMAVVARAWTGDPGRWRLGFWAALGVSLLVKGPLGPMVVLLALGALSLYGRETRTLRRLWSPWGLALMLVIAVPWYVAISYVSGGEFWSASLGRDMLGKVATAQENHGAPPGSYLAALWLTFWPGSMVLAASLPALWRARRSPVVIFALAWALPTFLVFELTPTKLIHYTLPTWPALALLLGAVASAAKPRWPALLPAFLPLILLAALEVTLRGFGQGLSPLALPGALFIALAALLTVAALRHGTLATTAALALAGFAFNATLFPTLARTTYLWPAPQLAAISAQHPDCAFSVTGFNEPSIVFTTDAKVRLAAPEDLPAILQAPGCQLIAAPSLDTTLPELTRIQGLDLGSGKPIDLGLWLKP